MAMDTEIRYYSTNYHQRSEKAPFVPFREALLEGIAPDEGLYIFDKVPSLSEKELQSWKTLPYPELAERIFHKWLSAEIPNDVLSQITQEAYSQSAGWLEGAEVPLQSLGPNTYLAKLDQGPSASFKDYAAQWMSRMMSYCKAPEQGLNILVATSGDTGGAVGEAFQGQAGIQVLILYPEKEVSPVQKYQLEVEREGVRTLAIQGKFDDCQALVKEAFLDPDLNSLNLSSANSINIGRLIPQSVYYVYCYLQLVEVGEPLIFSIPSGNMGNALGCEIARRMGVPISRIVVGTNANRSFPDFMHGKDYQKISPSLNCLSNAMNIGNPSNLARFFDLYQGWLDKQGRVHTPPQRSEMQKTLAAYAFSDDQTREIMQRVYQEKNLILEPHGAIGLLAWEAYQQENPGQGSIPGVVMQTAHPGKFTEIIEEVLGAKPQPNASLAQLLRRDRKVDTIAHSYAAFKQYLLDHLTLAQI